MLDKNNVLLNFRPPSLANFILSSNDNSVFRFFCLFPLFGTCSAPHTPPLDCPSAFIFSEKKKGTWKKGFGSVKKKSREWRRVLMFVFVSSSLSLVYIARYSYQFIIFFFFLWNFPHPRQQISSSLQPWLFVFHFRMMMMIWRWNNNFFSNDTIRDSSFPLL